MDADQAELLEEEVRRLRKQVQDRDEQLADLKTENAGLKSEMEIRSREIQTLSLVVERDQMRVKAEIAAQAARIAIATRKRTRLETGE